MFDPPTMFMTTINHEPSTLPVASYASVALLVPMLFFSTFCRYQDRFSIRGRVLGSLTASMLAFVACCIFVVAKGVSTGLLFTATMVFIITSGLATAILQVRQGVYRRRAN